MVANGFVSGLIAVEGEMDSREFGGEFGLGHELDRRDPGKLENAAIEPVDPNALAPAPSPDGDGAMLGRVLVYASIVVVGCAMLFWKHGQ
jgi:hypothetical protein